MGGRSPDFVVLSSDAIVWGPGGRGKGVGRGKLNENEKGGVNLGRNLGFPICTFSLNSKMKTLEKTNAEKLEPVTP